MIKTKILQFLEQQYQKKSEPERKRREKANSPQEILEIDNKLAELQQKYQFDTWIENITGKIKEKEGKLCFPTHLSKGIHPDSKGNNVHFINTSLLPNSLIGSQTIPSTILDITTGNAADSRLLSDLATFLDILIDEEKEIKLKDLLLNNSPQLKLAFSDNEQLSEHYKQQFQAALKSPLNTPCTHERNKQLLWANGIFALQQNDYINIIPLYPSALAHFVYQKIQQIRFSAQNKNARENRKKEKAEQQPYVSLSGLAYTKLGGSKPQNISQLNSQQGGKHYLLPSLPPIFNQQQQNFRLPLTSETFFTEQLYFYCYQPFQKLFTVIANPKNTYKIREKRNEVIQEIIEIILQIAKDLQQQDPGWSKAYKKLPPIFKYWLDPQRGNLDGEAEFKTAQQKQEWKYALFSQFSLWINTQLKKRFPHIEQGFSDAEANEWFTKMQRSFELQQE